MGELEEQAIKAKKYPLELGKREKRAYEMAKGEKLADAGVKELNFDNKINSLNVTLKSDGVGTKILLAEAMNKYDTIGIDAVAMTANDVICVGGTPYLFVDYLAQNHDNIEIHREILKGVEKGCNMAGGQLVGGETATLGEMIQGYGNGYHFDLATTCFGILFNQSPNGENISESDVIVGLKSNGLHSNGFLWARPALLKEFNPNAPFNISDKLENGETIGEEMLKPTLIYVKPILEMLDELDIKGIAHITGGAYKIKLVRIATRNISFVLDNMPEPPEIFKLLQKYSNASNYHMYESLNMGIGLCIVLPKKEAEIAVNIAEEHGFEAQIIGYAKKENKSRVLIPSKDVTYEKII